jgi:hypothetical protein
MVLFIILIAAGVLLITFIILSIYCFKKKSGGAYRNSFTSNAHKGYGGIQHKHDANNTYEDGDNSMDRSMSN